MPVCECDYVTHRCGPRMAPGLFHQAARVLALGRSVRGGGGLHQGLGFRV